MKKLIALMVMLAVSTAAAQTPPAGTVINMSWTPSMEYTDNTPIPAGTPMTYNVYAAVKCTACPCSNPTFALSAGGGGLTSTTRQVQNPQYPVIDYVVTEVVAGMESGYSNESCWSYSAASSSSSSSSSSSAAPKKPGAPTLTITTTLP